MSSFFKNLIATIFGIFGISSTNAENSQITDPIFRDIQRGDTLMNDAFALASSTINDFIKLVQDGGNSTYMAKLRFKDPELSKKHGIDPYIYIWLNNVVYHPKEKLLSGVFFELPGELEIWHHVGQQLSFEVDDVFDWMVNDNGHVKGAFTIRVTRSKLKTDIEKKEYDDYIGISSYENISDYN